MAIKKSFGGSSIRKPGAYSKSRVDQSGGAPLADNGTLLIVGESETGRPGDVAGMQKFSASQMSELIAEFGSGPIVDCALAAVQPSKTPGIQGADEIIVWKTNSATQASKMLQNATPANLIQIKSRQWGLPGNYITVQVAAGTDAARQRIISIRQGEIEEILDQNAAQAQLSISYIGSGGSAATLTISGASENAKTLTTTVTGESASDLNIALKDYTMKDLVDYINAFNGGDKYAAVLLNTQSGTVLKGTELDPVTASNIDSTVVNFYRLQNELVELVNENSALAEAEKVAIVIGVPAVSAEAFLTGGAKGASATSDFTAGFAAALAEDCNVILPAISADASADIADDLTDAASAYDIESVHAALDTHLRLRGNIKNRREAQGNVGYRKNTKAAVYTQCQSLSSELIQLSFQDVLVIDAASAELTWKRPHVHAALIAGLRLGTEIGEPLTHKFLNCSGQGHFVNAETGIAAGDFKPETDFDQAIDAGATFSEQAAGGFRIVVDNTTYGKDQSFVFNRGSVMEAAQYVAKTIRETAELVFVGQKTSNGIAQSIKSVLRAKLRELNAAQIITSSDDAPEGFVEESFTVTVTGNTALVRVEIKPVQGLDFVFIEFTLGEIRQSA